MNSRTQMKCLRLCLILKMMEKQMNEWFSFVLIYYMNRSEYETIVSMTISTYKYL